MRFGDIAGYMYRADLYCSHCIRRIIPFEWHAINHGLAHESTETLLDSMAKSRGIDRKDERSFDSDDFPKVVLFDNLHDQRQRFPCGSCGRELAR